MRKLRTVFKRRVTAFASLAALLAGCSSEVVTSTQQPSFYASMATPDAVVDATAAASMISGYRANSGLGR